MDNSEVRLRFVGWQQRLEEKLFCFTARGRIITWAKQFLDFALTYHPESAGYSIKPANYSSEPAESEF